MQSEAFLGERVTYPSQEDLSCSVCQDIYKDPVVLSCSHIFCKCCLKSWWAEKQTWQCPICEEVSLQTIPPVSPLIKNLCEAFLQERGQREAEDSGALCSLHFERLKLFCLDHQQPVCVVCLHSKAHNDHRFRPIDEAAQDNKEQLRNVLKPLQKTLRDIEEFKGECVETSVDIKLQAQHTEKRIRQQFEELHQFLKEEEEARIAALREEEEQKSETMEEKIEALSREISALSDTVRDTEEKLRAKDVSFLQNYKVSTEKVQQHPLLEHPELVSDAKIDVGKHVGNLTFNILNNVKQMVAQRQGVTEDTQTLDGESLGPEGSSVGTHSWEAETGDNADCVVGVLEPSQTEEDKVSGFWRIWLFNDEYTAHSSTGPTTAIPVKKVKKIRVHLDWSARKLSLCDADTDTHLQTFTHTLTEEEEEESPCATKEPSVEVPEGERGV